jgi:hypothetical protein
MQKFTPFQGRGWGFQRTFSLFFWHFYCPTVMFCIILGMPTVQEFLRVGAFSCKQLITVSSRRIASSARR